MDYCDQQRVSPFITSLTAANIGWPDKSTYPNGQWSKGHVSVMLGGFFADLAQRHLRLDDDPLLPLAVQANAAIQHCMSVLYASDVWMTKEVAMDAANSGLQFLDLYKRLALVSHRLGRPLFALMPKAHAVEHVFWNLKVTARAHNLTLNPLIWSVQVDEDFIGKTSRLARRTAPGQVIRRVLERNLQAACKHWAAAGWIK